MIPINLIYLKYFCDAVRLKSISASAKVNFVSQSAVSQAIVKLEKHFGKKLTDHKPNHFKLTLEGEMLFEKGEELLHRSKTLHEELAEEGKELQGKVHIACTHSFANAVLPSYLKKLREKYPKLQIDVHLGHLGIIQDLIRKGVVDLGIAPVNEDLSQFDVKEVYQGQYRLYVAKNEKMPSKLPFILSEEREETALLKKAYKKHFGKNLPVLMEVQSWEVIASFVEAGLGIGFFPDYVAHKRKRVLRSYELKLGRFPYSVCAIFQKRKNIPRKIQIILDIFIST